MEIVYFLLLGIVAGWLAGLIMKGGGVACPRRYSIVGMLGWSANPHAHEDEGLPPETAP